MVELVEVVSDDLMERSEETGMYKMTRRRKRNRKRSKGDDERKREDDVGKSETRPSLDGDNSSSLLLENRIAQLTQKESSN